MEDDDVPQERCEVDDDDVPQERNTLASKSHHTTFTLSTYSDTETFFFKCRCIARAENG